MKFEQVKDVRDKMKTYMRKIQMLKVLKIVFIISWLILLLSYLLSDFGRIFITVLGYIVFILLFSFMGCFMYLEMEEAIKRKQSIEDEDAVIPNDSIENSEFDTTSNNESVVNTKMAEEAFMGKNEKIMYLLETSTFFALDEYTRCRGHYVSDIVYDDMVLNDSILTLVEAIETYRCFVTKEVLDEVICAEKEGKLRKGISDFIEEDIGILTCQNIEPEEYQKLMLQEDIDNGKKYKPKYFNLVWNAIYLADRLDTEVSIVTFNKKIINLARANQIEVVNLWEMQP